MANRVHNPSTVAAPIGSYSHAIEVPPNARWLYISGQIGIGPDGKVGEGIARQAELVKVTTYLTRKEDIAESRAARARALGDVRPASTLVVVSALASPDYLIEVEAHAARA
jgi:enamine deaminase RidA (YjgF/YER057c/UK114 family)